MILSKLRLSWKFAFSGIVFVIPVGVMLFIVISTASADIGFSSLETKGILYQRPLSALMKDVIDIERAVLYASSSGSADIGTRIDKDLALLDDMQKRFSGALATDDAGLQRRGRGDYSPAKLAERLAALKADGPDKARDDATWAIEAIRALIAHSGDSSNLILDPDLDSYYTMYNVVVLFPQTLNRMNDIALEAGDAFQDSSVDETEKTTLKMQGVFMKQSDFDQIVVGDKTILSSDQDFYGVSPSLQQGLPPADQAYQDGMQKVLGLLADVSATDSESFQTAMSQAFDATAALWTVSATELGKLLDIRIAAKFRAVLTEILLALAAVLLAAIIMFVLSRRILSRIKSLTVAIDAMAHKDLTVSPITKSQDELGQATASFSELATKLRDSFSRFARSTGSLRKMSVGLDGASEGLNAIGDELGASISQISATLEQFMRTLEQVGANVDRQFDGITRVTDSVGLIQSRLKSARDDAEGMSTKSRENLGDAENGRQTIENSIVLSRSVHSDLKDIADRVRLLEKESLGISEILKIIKTIAAQTSLLAMNASIEAAHAGDAGRGFSVVAEEIGKLSASTTASVGDISKRIKSIDAGIRNTLDLGSRGESQARSLLDSAANVETAIHRIIDYLHGSSEMVSALAGQLETSGREIDESQTQMRELRDFSASIRDAVSEQTIGASEILDSIHAIKHASDKNLEASGTIRTVSSGLNSESQGLDEGISGYKF